MNPHHLERLSEFIEGLRNDVYPEAPSDLHHEITRRALEFLGELFQVSPGMKVLDVGCGQGPAATWFVHHGCEYRGVTLSQEEVRLGRSHGYMVDAMDQSFLEYPDQSFHLVWARHVLEHSPFPLFTLEGFGRVLKPGGLLYVEVPAPDTVSHHEKNPNHYSVFCKASWLALFERSGFRLMAGKDYFLDGPAGSDQYWGFYLQPADSIKLNFGALLKL